MKNNMKRMAAALMAVVTLAGGTGVVAACAEDASDQTGVELVGLANPWSEVESLEVLNAAADVNLQLPGVMGVSDVVYRLMTGSGAPLAEVDFAVNGVPYQLRGSAAMDTDISGVYVEGGATAFAGMEQEGYAVVTTDSMKLARWMDVGGQYVLSVEDQGAMALETFEGIVEELMARTNPFQPVTLAEGEYQDAYSMRAVASVTAAGENTYAIRVQWADSVDSAYQWDMTASFTEDGLLNYSDCVKKLVVTTEDGTVTETEANLIPTGYFEVVDGALCWTGAAEEACQACVFQLPVE